MPRYCAVKLCNSRGGMTSKDNKRISFYPFPLRDKARLNKWIVNMKREEWRPSRHQYLCSEHFTEDSFDIRWGIRYLKHTAIPTIFPCVCKNETDQSKKKNKPRKRPPDPDVRLIALTNETLDHPEPSVIMETTSAVHTDLVSLLSWTLSTRGDLSNHALLLTESCMRMHGEEQQPQVQSGSSSVLFLCCDTTGPEEECEKEERATHGTPGRMTELPVEGGVSSLCEHSYSLQDTDRTQLWSRIAGLHAEVLALDKQEERAHSRIRSVEREIEHLKRHNAVCQHKVLEEYFTLDFL